MRQLLLSFLCLALILPSGLLRADENQNYLDRSQRAEKWVFEDLPRHIGNDFKETFWNPWHFLALAGGAGLILGVHQKDIEIQNSFQRNRPFGSTFDKVVNISAEPLLLGGVALVTTGISKLAGSEKIALTSGTLLEALTLTEILTVGLKQVTQRRRPDGSDHSSFPSGHAAGAFALASVAAIYYGPWAGIPSYALASLVGVVRIDSNKHFTGDVLAGALLGTLMGLGTAKFHKKEFSNFFIVPQVDEDSAGLALVQPF